VLDLIGSWEWTIPGGTGEIQRTVIGERGLRLAAARADRLARCGGSRHGAGGCQYHYKSYSPYEIGY
jgi:hypothetical protein